MKNVLLTILCALIIVTGCNGEEAKAPEGETQQMAETTDRPIVVIKTEHGDIKIELRPDKAPKTVENFLKLTNEGFYDSLTFHRIVPGFVVQGGDPKGDGTGGPGYTVPAEISPDLKHVPGAVATARQGDQVNPERASSGSQFYIVLKPAPHLDNQYTIFGNVIEGMDAVYEIEKTPLADPRMGRPQNPIYILKAEEVTE
ncbi:MAG TPA: peptidylprolyl isomerase [candidate division Zixibacteria bacterium]|mgnify:CR=1 FL=1|nr:peptidylprolyl isomerase [candidate division Zixibacteria bacterium]